VAIQLSRPDRLLQGSTKVKSQDVTPSCHVSPAVLAYVADLVGVSLLAQKELPLQGEVLLDGIAADERVEMGLVRETSRRSRQDSGGFGSAIDLGS